MEDGTHLYKNESGDRVGVKVRVRVRDGSGDLQREEDSSHLAEQIVGIWVRVPEKIC